MCERRQGRGTAGQRTGRETRNSRDGNRTRCVGMVDGGNKNQRRERSGNRGWERDVTRFPVPVPSRSRPVPVPTICFRPYFFREFHCFVVIFFSTPTHGELHFARHTRNMIYGIDVVLPSHTALIGRRYSLICFIPVSFCSPRPLSTRVCTFSFSSQSLAH